jgi:cobyrinic acid a,c-diamide synthase
MRDFDPGVRIAGCILNRTGSNRHRQMVEGALPAELRRLVIGAIPHSPDLAIPERHLGLLTVQENSAAESARASAQLRAGQQLDLDGVTRIAGLGGNARRVEPTPGVSRSAPRARLAIARDDAFCFYYEDNLRLLRDAGFELVPFRPTVDPALPEDVDAVYIGGGYPESFAAELTANESLTAQLRGLAEGGAPIYAECGGLVYLGRSLVGFDGTRHAMCGVLPLEFEMDASHLAISYVAIRTRASSPLGDAGTVARGQEFHQSRVVQSGAEPGFFDLTTSDGATRSGGYLKGNVVASYVHLHFASAPGIADSFFRAARNARSADRRTSSTS